MSRIRGLLLGLIPAACLMGLAAMAIWGNNGLLEWYGLKRHAEAERAEWARVERENERLMYELRLLEDDPVNLERLVADELGWARDGTVIHRFGGDSREPPAGSLSP